ncbi:hypothetical protein J4476_02995 [Candidatus Woesearchaeota archaeon]|nr:hypothetical protein [Candidatus Woesearchaeota archaeon]
MVELTIEYYDIIDVTPVSYVNYQRPLPKEVYAEHPRGELRRELEEHAAQVMIDSMRSRLRYFRDD